MTFRGRKHDVLSESRMREIRQSWFDERCALQAHEIQLPEMVTTVKLSQQLCTESCVVSGNGHHEA